MEPLPSPYSAKSARGSSLRGQTTKDWVSQLSCLVPWLCINSEKTRLVRRFAFNAGNEKYYTQSLSACRLKGVMIAKHLLLRPFTLTKRKTRIHHFISMTICSLLPLSRELLCCPSEWVSESNNRIRVHNELCWSRCDIPVLRDFSGDGVFFRVFYRNVASYVFGPSLLFISFLKR